MQIQLSSVENANLNGGDKFSFDQLQPKSLDSCHDTHPMLETSPVKLLKKESVVSLYMEGKPPRTLTKQNKGNQVLQVATSAKTLDKASSEIAQILAKSQPQTKSQLMFKMPIKFHKKPVVPKSTKLNMRAKRFSSSSNIIAHNDLQQASIESETPKAGKPRAQRGAATQGKRQKAKKSVANKTQMSVNKRRQTTELGVTTATPLGNQEKQSQLKQHSVSYKSLALSESRKMYRGGSSNRLRERNDSAVHQVSTRKSGSFLSQERARQQARSNIEHSLMPGKRTGHLGATAELTRLHGRVQWFYRKLCERNDCPIVPQFLRETIPAAFKEKCYGRSRKASGPFSEGEGQDGYETPTSTNNATGANISKAKTQKIHGSISGVVQIDTSILSEKNVAAIFDTLRSFQHKIKILELYHNAPTTSRRTQALFQVGGSKNSPSAPGTVIKMASPSRSLTTQLSTSKAFPRPHTLFQLLKSLTRATTLRIICDAECSTFIQDLNYQAFLTAIGHCSATEEQKNQPSSRLRRSHKTLSTIDFQACLLKPSFFSSLVTTIQNKKMRHIVSLSLLNCGLQDTEGSNLFKQIILGKETPELRKVNVAKNNLGFKFGASLIAMLIDAQAIAQDETMNAVTAKANSSATASSAMSTLKFESLDHFALEKIDLDYNKLSFLVIQTVEKLLKNLMQFKEQARYHQNMIQMQTTAAGRSQQQGNSLPAMGANAREAKAAATYGMEKNKVIIEQTEESSATSTHTSQLSDSFDRKDVRELLEEFLQQNHNGSGSQKAHSCKRNRSTDLRRGSFCRTPDLMMHQRAASHYRVRARGHLSTGRKFAGNRQSQDDLDLPPKLNVTLQEKVVCDYETDSGRSKGMNATINSGNQTLNKSQALPSSLTSQYHFNQLSNAKRKPLHDQRLTPKYMLRQQNLSEYSQEPIVFAPLEKTKVRLTVETGSNEDNADMRPMNATTSVKSFGSPLQDVTLVDSESQKTKLNRMSASNNEQTPPLESLLTKRSPVAIEGEGMSIRVSRLIKEQNSSQQQPKQTKAAPQNVKSKFQTPRDEHKDPVKKLSEKLPLKPYSSAVRSQGKEISLDYSPHVNLATSPRVQSSQKVQEVLKRKFESFLETDQTKAQRSNLTLQVPQKITLTPKDQASPRKIKVILPSKQSGHINNCKRKRRSKVEGYFQSRENYYSQLIHHKAASSALQASNSATMANSRAISKRSSAGMIVIEKSKTDAAKKSLNSSHNDTPHFGQIKHSGNFGTHTNAVVSDYILVAEESKTRTKNPNQVNYMSNTLMPPTLGNTPKGTVKPTSEQKTPSSRATPSPLVMAAENDDLDQKPTQVISFIDLAKSASIASVDYQPPSSSCSSLYVGKASAVPNLQPPTSYIGHTHMMLTANILQQAQLATASPTRAPVKQQSLTKSIYGATGDQSQPNQGVETEDVSPDDLASMLKDYNRGCMLRNPTNSIIEPLQEDALSVKLQIHRVDSLRKEEDFRQVKSFNVSNHDSDREEESQTASHQHSPKLHRSNKPIKVGTRTQKTNTFNAQTQSLQMLGASFLTMVEQYHGVVAASLPDSSSIGLESQPEQNSDGSVIQFAYPMTGPYSPDMLRQKRTNRSTGMLQGKQLILGQCSKPVQVETKDDGPPIVPSQSVADLFKPLETPAEELNPKDPSQGTSGYRLNPNLKPSLSRSSGNQGSLTQSQQRSGQKAKYTYNSDTVNNGAVKSGSLKKGSLKKSEAKRTLEHSLSVDDEFVGQSDVSLRMVQYSRPNELANATKQRHSMIISPRTRPS